MPGFHDFHLHALFGALSLDCVNLIDAKSEQEAAEQVLRYAEAHPDEPWIIGMQWDAGYWHDQKQPNRRSLDILLPDRPIMLFHAEGHYSWVNSKALELAGIHEDTPQPEFGFIERDEDGRLTGLLYEHGQIAVTEKALNLSIEKKEAMFEKFLRKAAQLGITSINDLFSPIDAFIQDFELYQRFEDSGRLTSRMHITPELNEDLAAAQELRNRYCSPKLQFSGLKQFIDGVITGHTALMLAPYADQPQEKGHSAIESERLKHLVKEADQQGFRIRFHAIGDGAIRLALDSFEEAQNSNGKRDSRHAIEHIEVIHPDDKGRFAQLGVMVSMQPDHMAASERGVYSDIIGPEREKHIFSTKTLVSTGATLALGTDFPVAISFNPMRQIYTAVTRVDSSGNPAKVWHSDERISLVEALRAYTLGSAYGCFREHELGTLEVGKLADLIVMDRNLFNIPQEELLQAAVIMTVMDGEIVYQNLE